MTACTPRFYEKPTLAGMILFTKPMLEPAQTTIREVSSLRLASLSLLLRV